LRLFLCSILTLAGAAASDRAAFADATQDAEKLKKEGFAQFAAGDYAAGITSMEKAYTLVKGPGYLLNIAIAFDLWGGHCAEARTAFDRFFAQCRPSGCAELKTAEDRSKRVQDKCEVVISAKTDPTGATIKIDGREVGRAPIDAKIGPGTHELEASLEGYKTHVEALTVVEGRPQSLSFALRPIEVPKAPVALVAPPIAPVVAPREEEDGGLLSSPVFWIVTGVVVVGGGVALALALSSGTADPNGGTLGVVFTPGGR